MPSANAVAFGSTAVRNVTRTWTPRRTGRSRISAMSAALPAYFAARGYRTSPPVEAAMSPVEVGFGLSSFNALPSGSVSAPWSSSRWSWNTYSPERIASVPETSRGCAFHGRVSWSSGTVGGAACSSGGPARPGGRPTMRFGLVACAPGARSSAAASDAARTDRR